MSGAALKASLSGKFQGRLEEDVPLAQFTTFHIGGPADLLAVPKGLRDLLALAGGVAASGAKLLVLGRGSNVLVSDAGFRGVAVVVGKGLRRIRREHEDEVHVEGGCDLERLIAWTQDAGLGGLESLSGIPGTVGGGVRMNAGASGVCIGDLIEEISILRIQGQEVLERVLTPQEIGFAYRKTNIEDNEIIYEAKLKLEKKDKVSIERRRKEILEWRREHQPLRQPSAGSVFVNPPGESAGEIIDRCGLKGMRVGGAEVSRKHANFIVNTGAARADDVYNLIGRIKDEVRRREGIELEEEIRLIGEMGEELQ